MKTLILSLAIIFGCLVSEISLSQSYSSYTTESKKCGRCQKTVSNDSRVGMRCPHCGVIWGRENTSYTKETSYYYTNYETAGYFGIMTNSNANLRSYNSIYAPIKDVVPAYTNLKFLNYEGSWVKVKYSYYDYTYGYITETGWIHESLLSIY